LTCAIALTNDKSPVKLLINTASMPSVKTVLVVCLYASHGTVFINSFELSTTRTILYGKYKGEDFKFLLISNKNGISKRIY
jgi:hypothetical protein